MGCDEAPTPEAMAVARLSGKYVRVVPLSRMTGRARLFCENWLFPALLSTETASSTTVKDVVASLSESG